MEYKKNHFFAKANNGTKGIRIIEVNTRAANNTIYNSGLITDVGKTSFSYGYATSSILPARTNYRMIVEVVEVVDARKSNGNHNFNNKFFTLDNISITHQLSINELACTSYSDYRYGWNSGSERDDEIKGAGNSYTTHFRQLDTRLGRWLSIDPKMSAWESPYVSMGNTPIWANDVNGDKFKKQRHKKQLESKIQERKGDIQSNISNIENKISNINTEIEMQSKIISDGGEAMDGTSNSTISELNKQKSNLESMLKEERWMLGEMNNALVEIDLMEKSEVLFVTRRNVLRGQNGGSWAKSPTKVIIGFGDRSAQIHEFKHGFQFLKGDLSFNGGNGDLYDITDEEQAYQRDYAFNPIHKAYKGSVNIKTHSDLSGRYIKEKIESYRKLPDQNLNLNNIPRFTLSPTDFVVPEKHRVK